MRTYGCVIRSTSLGNAVICAECGPDCECVVCLIQPVPTTELALREWLEAEVWVPYNPATEAWPGRDVTRWILHGYGSIEDAVNTYRRHGHLT